MRNEFKLLLVGTMAVAAIALGASPASAQSLSVNEEGGSGCPAVSLSGTDVNGGCLTHATSEGNIELRKHVFGIESHITACGNEFAGRVDSNAEGHILEQVLSGASCSRQACAPASEGTPWGAHGDEGFPQGVSEGSEFLTTSFCVEPKGGGTDETCEIDVPFQSYSNQHRQEYGHVTEMSSHGISGFRCELVGHWNSETGGSHDGQAEQEGVITHSGGGGVPIDLDEDTIDFNHAIGSVQIEISNPSGTEVTTEDVVFSGSGASRYEADTGCKAKMLGTGGTCTVTITQMNTTNEDQEARLKISYMIGTTGYTSTDSVHLIN